MNSLHSPPPPPALNGDPCCETQNPRNAPKTFHFHDISANGTSSLHAPGNKERRPLGAYPVSPETQAPLVYEIVHMGSTLQNLGIAYDPELTRGVGFLTSLKHTLGEG